MRAFYTSKGIDLLIDAVSLVAYLLRDTIEPGVRAVQLLLRSLCGVKRNSRWRAKPGVHGVSRGRSDAHQTAAVYTTASL